MFTPTPKRPAGNSPLTALLQWMYDSILALRPQQAPGMELRRTSRGFTMTPSITARAGIGLARYKFRSMDSEHILCRTWDGTTEGASDVKIAKPAKLRHTITSEVIDGVTVTYSGYNPSAQARSASGSNGTSENQVVVPRYLVGDVLYVWEGVSTGVTVVGATSEVLTRLDANIDARAWMAV